MKKTIITNLFIFLIIHSVSIVFGQISGNHLFEYQLGNIPRIEPTDLSTGYSQLNLKYRQKGLWATARVEQFITADQQTAYQNLSQYQIRFKQKGFDVRIGNFYDILGRGLLLRSYEIPGTLLEEAAYRVRYGFYKDIEGIRIAYKNKFIKIKGLHGQSLINVLPPTLERKDRRLDTVSALELELKIGTTSLGSAYMQNQNKKLHDKSKDYLSVQIKNASLNPISLYAEFAQQVRGDFKDEKPKAFYGGMNYSNSGLGISLEYKDYQHFFLGSGLNDPPPLIREHSASVLNRSAQVLDLNDESGWQIETYYQFETGQWITFNHTYAVNEFYKEFIYREYFIEMNSPIGKSMSISLFFDWAEDPFKLEENRLSSGLDFKTPLIDRWHINTVVEYQTFERPILSSDKIENTILKGTVSRTSKISLTIIWETSTDPLLTDDIRTIQVETKRRHWLGVAGFLKFLRNHTMSIFWGERRGGPACTAGICHEVLDFKGLEFRLTSKF